MKQWREIPVDQKLKEKLFDNTLIIQEQRY